MALGSLKLLWGNKTKSSGEPATVIADLDDIVSRPIAFRVHGKVFEVRPVTMDDFLKLADVLAEAQDLAKGKEKGELKEKEIYEAYLRFIKPLCPKFTMKDLKSMEVPQIMALVSLIIRHMTGRVNEPGAYRKISDEKKKDQSLTPNP